MTHWSRLYTVHAEDTGRVNGSFAMQLTNV